MTITHAILNKTEEKINELDGGKTKDCIKAFGYGCIEGFIESAAVVGAFVLVQSWIKAFKKDK